MKLFDLHVHSNCPVNYLNFEMKSSIRWNHTASSSSTIGILRWANKLGLLTLLELADAFIPSSNDLADTNLEFKGLAAGD